MKETPINTPGLRKNLTQFLLLVLMNSLVGGMVGLERSILPDIGREEFGLKAHAAILSFIVVFGVSKAISNYFMGKWANRFGRKRMLVFAWICALPIPWIFMYAESWTGIIFANVLLGVNQGFAWSSTVIMKIDLVGEKHRGLAMGLNESSGYLSLALVAYLTALIASHYSLRPEPFYLGVGITILALLGSIFLIRDTRTQMKQEGSTSEIPRLERIFASLSYRNASLSSITQAGLTNNLVDGMAWGLFPFFFAKQGFETEQIALLIALYPAIWGIGQLFTGKLGDHVAPKKLLVSGMALQGLALGGMVLGDSLEYMVLCMVLLGLGTALVYPNFLTAIAARTHPLDRASALGVFRLWRDMGYAVGALLSSLIADTFGMNESVLLVAFLSLFAAGNLTFRMKGLKS
ncbi:MAG: MFS transporter [Bacteroidetes bacterium]|nr:MAG: MFS transporter [Bacteroidota bacterium]